MSRDTVLSSAELEVLGEQLTSRKAQVLAELAAELEASDDERHQELAKGVRDSTDVSIAQLLDDVNLAIIRHHGEEIRDIEAALARIAAGTYGQCVSCGVPVPLERLQAYPTATRCLACQQSQEQPGE